MIARIEELLEHETAGDPMTGLKWTRRTTEKIAEQLWELGIDVSARTVSRLLEEMDFSLRVNHKKVSSGSGADRDEQFLYIAKMRQRFARQGRPVVSIDTKKKELVGNFKNGGTAWNSDPVLVNDHDFRSAALGLAIPYGIYDVGANLGWLFVGTSHDTSEFAVDNLARWWVYDGRRRYSHTTQLLILADGGGSNAPRTRAWRLGLQERLCDRHGLTVTVSHYPTGASKWNPIEHRLFGEISKNWAGRPLDSYETILNYARSTTTSTGLAVKSYLVKRHYDKGVRISDEALAGLQLERHDTQPDRNYTLTPR